MRAGLLAIVLAFFVATPAAAQSDTEISARYSREWRQCVDASGGVTVEMRDCSAAEYERQDVRLNAAYRATMARLNRAGQTRLRTLQRAWLRDRRSRCLNPPDAEGGTLDLILIDACFLDTTIERTIWLERYRG
jgi:uncharacterized protein YecT (DUF1311 family)